MTEVIFLLKTSTELKAFTLPWLLGRVTYLLLLPPVSGWGQREVVLSVNGIATILRTCWRVWPLLGSRVNVICLRMNLFLFFCLMMYMGLYSV